MSDFAFVMLAKPFIALVIFGGIVAPIKFLVHRKMKEGPLKRLLFRRIGN